MRTYTCTAQVSKSGHRKLARFLDLGREVSNAALEERWGNLRWNKAMRQRQDAHMKAARAAAEHGPDTACTPFQDDVSERRVSEALEAEIKYVTYYDQCKSLTRIREEHPEYAEFSVSAMRSLLKRVDWSWKRFIAKDAGRPRFRGRDRAPRSFETDQFTIRRSGGRWAVCIKGFAPFRLRSVPKGPIKLVRVVVTARRVVVQFVVMREFDAKAPAAQIVGADLGVESQVTFSDGTKAPKRTVNRERLRWRQQSLSRKRRGSKSREKDKALLRKEHQRIAESERGYLHQLTTEIVRTHGPYIAVEDLRIRNMTRRGGSRKKGLNRSILEQRWGMFIAMLAYKCEAAGGRLVKVPPRNTSKTCSACATVKDRILLSQRVFECESCGFRLHRDVNAARNVGIRGREILAGGTLPHGSADVELKLVVGAKGGTPPGVDPLQRSRNHMPNALRGHSGI